MMIDKEELQIAVEQYDEKKLYYLFGEMVDTMGYKYCVEYEDWRHIAISRAFKYIPKYTPERGKAFSYFYRVMYMQLMYEYRSTVRGKYRSMYKVMPLLGDEVVMDDKDNIDYVKVGNRYFFIEDVQMAYSIAKNKKTKTAIKEEFLRQLHILGYLNGK